VGADFLSEGARAKKAAVSSNAVHSDSIPAANIIPE
jgi:hypothetical protein